MREIITLSAGSAGNNVAHSFWGKLCQEHKVDEQGMFNGKEDLYLDRLPTFFRESKTGRFVPLATLFDTESHALNTIRTSYGGSLYHPHSYYFGQAGAQNCYARGRFGGAKYLIDAVLNSFRVMCETCDSPQGFQMIHSISGGTGSGTASAVIEGIRHENPKLESVSYTLYPSVCNGGPREIVVDPYNSVLSQAVLTEHVEQVICMDNASLFGIVRHVLNYPEPVYGQLNDIIALVMMGVTGPLRFPGNLNLDMRSNATNLIPYPRLHFFCPSFAPLVSAENSSYANNSYASLMQRCFDLDKIMYSVETNEGKYLANSLILRGQDSCRTDVLKAVAKIQEQYADNFISWLPGNIKVSNCEVSHEGYDRTVTMLSNTTAISQTFSRLAVLFKKLYEKEAFLHSFEEAGMDVEDFASAEHTILDLAEEYQQYANSDQAVEEE